MSMLMLMLALFLSSLHAILVVASESSIGNVYVHELLREVVSEYSGHHKNYRIEEGLWVLFVFLCCGLRKIVFTYFY